MTISPEVRYTRSADGTSIAYWQLPGPGDRPLIFVPDLHLHSIELEAADPSMSHFYERLSASRTVVRYDRRGIGLSEVPPADGYRFSDHLNDLAAVIDATGASEVDIWGGLLGIGLVLSYAGAYPDQIGRVVLWRVWGDYSRALGAPPRSEALRRASTIQSIRDDRELWAAGLGKTLGGTSAEAAALYTAIASAGFEQYTGPFRSGDLNEHQTNPRLEAVRAPVLILQPRSAGWPEAEEEEAMRTARLVAGRLADARLRLLQESVGLPGFGDTDEVVALVNEFLGSDARVLTSGGLTTVLFTDVVSSTPLLSQLKDERMRAVMRDHDAVCEAAITEHGGRVVKTIGDAFMAEFGVPSAAIEAAIAIQRGVREQFADSDVPIRLRIGINAGEPIVEDGDLHGASVVIAKRLESAADEGGILISDVVRQAVAGKDFEFEDRGEVGLKGFDQPVRAWAVSWMPPTADRSSSPE